MTDMIVAAKLLHTNLNPPTLLLSTIPKPCSVFVLLFILELPRLVD